MLKIENPQDLAKLIDLCRKKGVETIKVDGIELKLRDEAPPSTYKRKIVETTPDPVLEPEYSDMDILLWSTPVGEIYGENNAQ